MERIPESERPTPSASVPDDQKTILNLVIIFPDLIIEEDKNGLARFLYLQKILRKESLTLEEWDQYLRKRYGRETHVKAHWGQPQMRAMHEFVENVKALDVEKDSWIRKCCRKEKEKYLDELLEYLRKALENRAWERCQGLMRIFEKAVTGNDQAFEVSNRVKIHQVMEKYLHKKVGEILAQAGSKPTMPYIVVPQKPPRSTEASPAPEAGDGRTKALISLPEKPPKSTESHPAMEIEVPSGATMGIIAAFPYPTREDLVEYFEESDKPHLETMVREARKIGFSLRNLPSWGSTN